MMPGVRAKQDRLAKAMNTRDRVRKAFADTRGSGVDVETEEELLWIGTRLEGPIEEALGGNESGGSDGGTAGVAMRLSRLRSAGPSTKAPARSRESALFRNLA